jgi:alpha-D-ribose 1-methylphosphonate 5-triphosphate synthase subunit PhnH
MDQLVAPAGLDMRPGFEEPVAASQRVFRALMDALSRPGRIVDLPALAQAPHELEPAAAAIGLGILDGDTSLWLPRDCAAAAAWLRFHTGCRIARSVADADFVFVPRGAAAPDLSQLRLGSDEAPHSSAMLVVAVTCLEAGSGARLTGPGIDGEARLSVVNDNRYRAEWEIGDRFVIEYSGNCGVGHDVSSVCDAMLALRDDDSIRWVIVGGGLAWPRIEEFIRRHQIPNVILRPYQPRAHLGDLIALGDAHLVLVADGFEGLLIPSKFYGVMAAGRPTIYIGPEETGEMNSSTSTSCERPAIAMWRLGCSFLRVAPVARRQTSGA